MRAPSVIKPIRRRQGRAAPTLVLIHGLFSSPLEFALLARWFRARGVRYELLEVPGYSRGGASRTTSRQWVAAAHAALDRRFAPDESIVLGGLCTGGAIAAALTQGPCRQSVEGLVMMSPTLDLDGWGVTRWRHLRSLGYSLGIDRWISVPEREPFGVKNEKMRRWIGRELATSAFSAVGPARLPLWGLKECERLYARLRLSLPDLDMPLLVLHARDDEITSLRSVMRWMTTLPEDRQLVVLEDSYHVVTIDNDRREVARCLGDFVGVPTRRGDVTGNRPVSEAVAEGTARYGALPPLRVERLEQRA